MLITVISEIELGSPRAHAINVIKTAGGFQRLGHEVIVICRRPADGRSAEEAASDYAEANLRFVFAPEGLERAEDPGEAFGIWASRAVSSIRPDLIYARTFWAPLICAERGLPTILETHAYAGDTNPLLLACLKAAVGPPVATLRVVTISARLRDYYLSCGASPNRVHIVPDGVDLDLFMPPDGTPAGDGPVTYAGHLYDYKGVPTILAAAREAPHIPFDLVGGLPEDIERNARRIRKMRLDNVTVRGRLPHAQVPPLLWNASALLLPPSAREPSKDWTSPVKLGEYLAAGPPIVASDIPALRDWVDEPVVRWFTPDNPRSLIDAIEGALGETAIRRGARRERAERLARQFSYPERARAILAAARIDGELAQSA